MQAKDGLFRGDYGAPFSIKEMDEEGQFEGYAATFNDVDQGNDVVLPGAFTASLTLQ